MKDKILQRPKRYLIAGLVLVATLLRCDRKQEQEKIYTDTRFIPIRQHYALGSIALIDLDRDGSFDLYSLSVSTEKNRISKVCLKRDYEKLVHDNDLHLSEFEIVDPEFFDAYDK